MVTPRPVACVIEPLGDTHDRAAFSCGVDPLDRYIKQQARQDVRRHLAGVMVLRLIQEPATIAGYYTLSATSVTLEELPPTDRKHLPRYPLPAILIGRLAIDRRYQKQGLGEYLLTDALQRSLRAEIGAVAVVVDAKDDRARSFYERYGFQRFPEREYRLFLMMKTFEELYVRPGPPP